MRLHAPPAAIFFPISVGVNGIPGDQFTLLFFGVNGLGPNQCNIAKNSDNYVGAGKRLYSTFLIIAGPVFQVLFSPDNVAVVFNAYKILMDQLTVRFDVLGNVILDELSIEFSQHGFVMSFIFCLHCCLGLAKEGAVVEHKNAEDQKDDWRCSHGVFFDAGQNYPHIRSKTFDFLLIFKKQ